MSDITYCSQTLCAHLDCVRHQYNAPAGDISIADLNDGLCFDPMDFIPNDEDFPVSNRARLLAAICKGTQNTACKCNASCKALCGNDGTCFYCATIADAIEEEFL